jgi:cell wall-associated NlpC family hydrolase
VRRTLATLFAALLACGAVTVAVASGHLARDRANGARLAVPARPATDPAPEPSGLQAVSPTGAALAEMNRRLGTPAQVARSARKRARQIARIEARLRKLAAIARADAARRAAAEAEAARLRLGMTGYSTPVGSGPAWSDPAAAAVPNRAPDSQAESQWLASGRGGWVEASGFARAPANAPPAIKRVIQAGNLIARSPYLWGGGHGQWQDQGYDCSGSVSYALATGGMLGSSLTSGQLMNWGVPGPGRWLTLYANGHHVFMVVAGLRFDTSGRAGDHASRWQLAPRSTDGFAVRHYPGL